MRISDWSSDVCSSDLWWSQSGSNRRPPACKAGALPAELWPQKGSVPRRFAVELLDAGHLCGRLTSTCLCLRSEEHTSELQSLMRISYAVFCLKKKKTNTTLHFRETTW